MHMLFKHKTKKSVSKVNTNAERIQWDNGTHLRKTFLKC